MNLYEARRYGKILLLAVAAVVVVVFLYVSTGLVEDLSAQERDRMEIWADATKEILYTPMSQTNIVFLLSILERNTTIPVLLADDDGNILQHRNFTLPETPDPNNPIELSPANEKFLKKKLAKLADTPNVIHISLANGTQQHLYYEDSTLLKRLSYYPYIQIIVMLAFVWVVYYALLSTKNAEQNKVWVGLSKETAHQLGTPISSLMAWMELLKSSEVDPDIVKEMNKDVERLSTIASRFGKIGSRPTLEAENLNTIVRHATDYMGTRISKQIKLTLEEIDQPLPVMTSAPLFEWVMENLIKNAVDAMEGSGSIDVTTGIEKNMAWVDVKDTGRGISRKNYQTVFNPGYTTKKRGWGLGLALAKRIIEQYHDGKIFVRTSAPGEGTTFRIELPLM